ncbi:bacteriochlorophyll 4-vinyl reductase [Roseibium sp. HPY-6]|uniref:bacteriochlorophyll 4-vinyl reductase n=1 Tax=Roseibium sp. HPY-6 TaxID=3229852 RepID=UPI00338E9E8C
MPIDLAAGGAGVVGPNAVVQLGLALQDHYGPQTAQAVFSRSGYPDLVDHPPDVMINETIPASLMAGLWATLQAEDAHAIALEAGRRTADYVIAHRIPRAAKCALACAPKALGARLLLKSIHRNAWTFCGSGVCTIRTSPPLALLLRENPIRTPGCVWHVAVLERLFYRLVSSHAQVTHHALQVENCLVDRFEIAVA